MRTPTATVRRDFEQDFEPHSIGKRALFQAHLFGGQRQRRCPRLHLKATLLGGSVGMVTVANAATAD